MPYTWIFSMSSWDQHIQCFDGWLSDWLVCTVRSQCSIRPTGIHIKPVGIILMAKVCSVRNHSSQRWIAWKDNKLQFGTMVALFYITFTFKYNVSDFNLTDTYTFKYYRYCTTDTFDDRERLYCSSPTIHGLHQIPDTNFECMNTYWWFLI